MSKNWILELYFSNVWLWLLLSYFIVTSRNINQWRALYLNLYPWESGWVLYLLSICREHAARQNMKNLTWTRWEKWSLFLSGSLYWAKMSAILHSSEATFLWRKQTAKTQKKKRKRREKINKNIAISTSRHFHVFSTFPCYCLFELRLMCTVLEFSSVRFVSENYRILTGVTSKLPWWQIACFELSFGDACSKMLKQDQVWKRLSVNSNNQCKIGFENICSQV